MLAKTPLNLLFFLISSFSTFLPFSFQMTSTENMKPEEIKALWDEAKALGVSIWDVVPSSKLANAITNKDVKTVRSILKKYPTTINEKYMITGHTPLVTAINTKDLGLVRLLLDAGANTDNVLEAAFKTGEKTVIVELLACGTKLTKVHTDPALMYAIRHEMYDLIQPLLEAGADINEFGQFREFSALMLAIDNKAPCEVIVQLLDAGADPVLEDGAGNTALHMAIVKHYTDAIDLLLVRGLVPKEHELTTALYSGRPDYAQRLLDADADIYEDHYYRGTYKSFLDHARDGVFTENMNKLIMNHHRKLTEVKECRSAAEVAAEHLPPGFGQEIGKFLRSSAAQTT